MSSTFSSNDTEVLERDADLNVDDFVATPINDLHNVYEIERCIKFIQVC